MFTKKKLTLLEKAQEALNKSKQIKSVFASMKDDLVNTNMNLMATAGELSAAAQLLLDQQQLMAEESEVNEKVINNIDKILGDGSIK